MSLIDPPPTTIFNFPNGDDRIKEILERLAEIEKEESEKRKRLKGQKPVTREEVERFIKWLDEHPNAIVEIFGQHLSAKSAKILIEDAIKKVY